MNCVVFSFCLAFLVQSAFSQAIGFNGCANGLPIANGVGPGVPINNAGPLGINNGIPGAVAANAANGLSLAGLPISGVSPIGYGDVAITGELPVGGTTAVVGNVPIIGFVTFEGVVPAAGTVALASNCGCNPLA